MNNRIVARIVGCDEIDWFYELVEPGRKVTYADGIYEVAIPGKPFKYFVAWNGRKTTLPDPFPLAIASVSFTPDELYHLAYKNLIAAAIAIYPSFINPPEQEN